MTTSLAVERTRLAADQQEAREAIAFEHFYRKHPEIESCEANDGLLRDFLAGIPVTLAALEEALVLMRTQQTFPLAERSVEREARRHDELAEEWLDLQRDKSDHFRKINRARLQYVPTEELERRVQNCKEEIRLRSMPVEDLRKERDEDTKRNHPAQTFPPLPPEFSRAVILASSPGAIRLLIRKYSEQAVNDRINGVS